MITVNIPIRTRSLSNQREHWAQRARRAKNERKTAWAFCLKPCAALPRGPMVITLTRHAPRKLDSDNLCGALKSLIDGVADALGIDDGSELIEWRYEQAKAKDYSVTIRIEKAVRGRAEEGRET